MPGKLQVSDSKTLWNTKGRGYEPGLFHLNTILLTVRSWSVDAIIPRRESVAKTMERHYPGLRKALDGILDRVKDSCKDTGDCIRYALELEQAILAWSLEQKPSRNRRKRIWGRLKMNQWLPQMPLWIL